MPAIAVRMSPCRGETTCASVPAGLCVRTPASCCMRAQGPGTAHQFRHQTRHQSGQQCCRTACGAADTGCACTCAGAAGPLRLGPCSYTPSRALLQGASTAPCAQPEPCSAVRTYCCSRTIYQVLPARSSACMCPAASSSATSCLALASEMARPLATSCAVDGWQRTSSSTSVAVQDAS